MEVRSWGEAQQVVMCDPLPSMPDTPCPELYPSTATHPHSRPALRHPRELQHPCPQSRVELDGLQGSFPPKPFYGLMTPTPCEQAA